MSIFFQALPTQKPEEPSCISLFRSSLVNDVDVARHFLMPSWNFMLA